MAAIKPKWSLVAFCRHGRQSSLSEFVSALRHALNSENRPIPKVALSPLCAAIADDGLRPGRQYGRSRTWMCWAAATRVRNGQVRGLSRGANMEQWLWRIRFGTARLAGRWP